MPSAGFGPFGPLANTFPPVEAAPMKKSALVLLLVVLGFPLRPPVLLAQEGDADAKAREAGKQLVAGIKDFDASLTGTYWFGILKGSKNIGKIKLVVAQAPAGEGTVYKTVSDLQMALGPITIKTYDEALLDACGSTISKETMEENPDGKKSTSVKKAGDAWVGKVSKGGRSLTSKLQSAVLDHWEIPNQYFLLRKIPLDKPGTYLLKGIDWPSPGAGGEGQPADVDQALPVECVKDIRIVVPAASKVTHRGVEVQAYLVRVERTGKAAAVFTIDEQHRILAISPERAPFRMMAGTEAEAGADLGDISAEAAAAAGPREAVFGFLDVIGGSKDKDSLDAVIDWKAVREALAKIDKEVAATSDADFPQWLKGKIKVVTNEAGKKQIELFKELLEFKVDGDTATASVPGQDQIPFHLKKVDGKWKIVLFRL